MRNTNSLTKFIGLVFLVMIIGSLLATTILPSGTAPRSSSSIQQPPASGATPTTPPVVFPTPNPDGPVLESLGMYVHPAGTFYIAQPGGYLPSAANESGIHTVTFVDNVRYSVVHAYIQYKTEAQDVSTLDAENNAAVLAGSWSQYTTWAETGRAEEDDRLVIDFALTLGLNGYLARQISWVDEADDTLVYVMRLVVPDNNPALLEALDAQERPSFIVLRDELNAPLEWPGVVDPVSGYAIRYPNSWTLVDGGPGRVTTLDGGSGTLTLDSESGQVADEDAAADWVRGRHDGADVLAVEPVTRTYGTGYAVAYGYPDADGEPQSGLALLFNGPGGRLVSVRVRMSDGGLNLLDADSRETQGVLWDALDTFAPLPEETLTEMS